MALPEQGLWRTNGSGDFAIALSTGNMLDVLSKTPHQGLTPLPARKMDPLFHATVEATREAILNAICAAETTTGFKGRIVHALPHDLIQQKCG